jgi:hypothetical protein
MGTQALFFAGSRGIFFDSRTFCHTGIGIGLLVAAAHGIVIHGTNTGRIDLFHTIPRFFGFGAGAGSQKK